MHCARHRPAIVLLLLSSHPGPSIAVAALCTVLAASTLELWRVVVVGFSVLLGQFSVGLSNDWLDASRDRTVGRLDKPVAGGEISAGVVRNSAVIVGAAGIALTSFTGLAATAAHTVFITAGWAYNLHLKKTALSVLPYVIGFGTLPAVVTLARDVPVLPAWWAVAAGATLGTAAHFANALPDLADDRKTGIIGLPHRVGPLVSSLITLVALSLSTALIVFGPRAAPTFAGWCALTAQVAIVSVGIILAFVRAPGRPFFRIVILGALVCVVSLALSGETLSS